MHRYKSNYVFRPSQRRKVEGIGQMFTLLARAAICHPADVSLKWSVLNLTHFSWYRSSKRFLNRDYVQNVS